MKYLATFTISFTVMFWSMFVAVLTFKTRPQIPELTEAQGKVVRTLTLEEVALFEDCMFNKEKTYTDCFLRATEPPRVRAKRKP